MGCPDAVLLIPTKWFSVTFYVHQDSLLSTFMTIFLFSFNTITTVETALLNNLAIITKITPEHH
jgi:hypothetical protein